MLCETCQSVFYDFRYEEAGTASPSTVADQKLMPSVFVKATHHSLPYLLQSAETCKLCALLWDSAPLDARKHFYELLNTRDEVEFLNCYFTIDRSIFDAQPRTCWLEYKYLTTDQTEENYTIPFKKHLKLFPIDDDLSKNNGVTGSNTGSPESYAVAARWINQCHYQHKSCSTEFSSNTSLPTRLLDVGDISRALDPSYIRLVRGDSLPPNTKYLALSHCWGLIPVYKLTAISATILPLEIEIAQLTRSFQQAISVTRELQQWFGVQYLWIDSLCIMQDSAEDWQSESAVMGEIYRNAFCTIAATASSDGNGGLFFERDPSKTSPCVVPVNSNGKSTRFICVDQIDWENKVSKAPLNSRSWVLQERLLSARVLHFAEDQLYWECSALEASEGFPDGLPEGSGEGVKKWFREDEKPNDYLNGLYWKWEKIVRAYTSGELTNTTDKLIAISGIAREMERHIYEKDSYLAGLWRFDIIPQLLWDIAEPRQAGQRTRIAQFVAPSWSWASRTGEISWESEKWVFSEQIASIEGAMIVKLGPDEYGQISDGFIRLCGRLHPVSLRRIHQPGSSQPGSSLEVRNTSLYGTISRSDDGFSFADPLPSRIYCFPLLCSQEKGIPVFRGLYLVPSGVKDGRFRRYGTFTATDFTGLFLSPGSETPLEGEYCNVDGTCVVTLV